MEPELRLIHLSDLHIGQNTLMNENSSSILKYISRKFGKDSENYNGNTFIVITGDIWNSKTKKDAKTAKLLFTKSQIFELLGKESVFLCPGNHDYKSTKNYSEQVREKYFFWKDYPCFETVQRGSTKYYFIGLDSNLNRKRGMVGEKQIKFLKDCFGKILKEKRKFEFSKQRKVQEEESEGENEDGKHFYQKVIVYLHHHPFISHPKNALSDRDEFMKALSRKCDVLLFGHHHVHRRLSEKEKMYNVPFILASGKCSGLKAYREISFFGKKRKPTVRDVRVK